jgi:hypothetical protein
MAAEEGFIIGKRIIYAAHYRIEGGSSIVVWFNRAGDDLNGRLVRSDADRAVITTKPGEVILHLGKPRTVASVEPYLQNWLAAEDRAANMKY